MWILYNILFYTVLYLIFLCHSIHSSLLSRLKNTYLYGSTANLEILPQDYFIYEFQPNYSYPNIYIRPDVTGRYDQHTDRIEIHKLPVIKFRDALKHKYSWRPTLGYTKGVPTLSAEMIKELELLGRTREEVMPESDIRRTLAYETTTSTTEVSRTSKENNITIVLSVTRTPRINISISTILPGSSTTLPVSPTTLPVSPTTFPASPTTLPVSPTVSRTWRNYFPTTITAAPMLDTLFPRRSSLVEETFQTTAEPVSETTYDTREMFSQFLYDTAVSPDVARYSAQDSVIFDPKMQFVLKKVVLKPIWLYPNMTNAIEREGNHTHTKRGVPRCYTCGLDEPGLSSSNCYDIFEGDDERKRQKMFKKRTKCAGPDVIGGCFKRYLDVGNVYNERGCRSKPPMRGKSYASKRFMLLEYLLHNVNDGCVASPHATLTPFSRSVSLYARFHVCVCSQRYCNGSTGNFYELPWILLILLWR